MPLNSLPVGKLPQDLLAELLATAPQEDPQIIVGPGIGFDCAVVSVGNRYLVLKSDPITFVSDDLGWYLVQVNVNDLATTGATPRWMLVTLLFPEGTTGRSTVLGISEQIHQACRELGISVVGGHTEITHGLTRPLAIGALIGEVDPQRLVTPGGMRPGDRLILTKGVPIEATAILANDFRSDLVQVMSTEDVARAADFLFEPGISVLRDAQIALAAGQVTAMHDPTEGGLSAALWELAQAANLSLVIDRNAIPIPPLAARVCEALNINPLAAIASGALLIAVAEGDVEPILAALNEQGVPAALIGEARDGPVQVWLSANGERLLLPRPERDAIAQLYEERSNS